ncbi:hypothetical protein D3C71_1966480 [compost metagenome]
MAVQDAPARRVLVELAGERPQENVRLCPVLKYAAQPSVGLSVFQLLFADLGHVCHDSMDDEEVAH